MSQAEAQKYAAAGDWQNAVAQMRQAIAARPDSDELWRQLIAMVEKMNDTAALRTALGDWAAADRWSGGLEAEERLLALEGRGNTVAARARHLIRSYRVAARERRLLSERAPFPERLSFLMYRGMKDELAALLRQTPLDRKLSLSPAMLRRITGFYISTRQPERLVPDLCDGDISHLERRQGIVATLAQALARADHIPEAEAAVALLEPQGPYLRAKFVAEHLIASKLEDPDRLHDILTRWAAKFPDDRNTALALLRARIDAGEHAEALAEITRNGFGLMAAPGALDLANRMIDAGELDQAFALLTLAHAEWPDNLRIDERLTAVALAVGEGDLAREARLRRIIREDLDADLIDMAGMDALIKRGGRKAVHDAVLGLLAEPGDPRGILDIAQMLMASLRIVTAFRTGERREARELAAFGAADWRNRLPDAERLARMIRALCALAMKAAPDGDEALRLLLELQLMMRADGALTENLVRSMVAEAMPRVPLDERLWTAALGCDAPDLWAEMAALDAARGAAARVMRFAPLLAEGAVKRHAGGVPTKRIGVTGPRFTGEVDLSLETRDEYATDLRAVDLWGGYLASVADSGAEPTVLDLVSNGYLPRHADRVRHVGALAVAVDPGGEPLVIDRPAVFVPGLRAHYRNYYHFTGQMLPRILALRAETAARSDGPVAVALPDFAAGFVSAMLAMGGITETEIVRIPVDRPVRLTRCAVASPTMHDWQCAAEDLSATRAALRGIYASSKPRRRIFLARPVQSVATSGRVLTNEAELIDVARDLGYEIVDPGVMTQSEQRALFTSAAVICGPTGAALTNALYLPDGARVVCLSPQETCRTYFPGLTLGQDVGFDWVLGGFDPELAASRKFPHLPYSIDPAHLRAVLSR